MRPEAAPPRRHLAPVPAAVAALALACAVREQSSENATPEYPLVDLSTSYEVDPTWPQRPSHCRWGHVPGIAVDSRDRVWVFTRANPPVQVYDRAGTFLFAWGDDIVKTAHHLEIDPEGHVWLADIGHHVVRKCTEDGEVLLTLGMQGEPGDDERHFNMPTDMAISPRGHVFVADGYGNSRIVRLTADGSFVRQWGRLGTAPGEFSIPHAIALDSAGRVYVADRNNARVQVFDGEGRFLRQWLDLVVPWGFWMTESDELWVCGSSPMTWRKGDEALGCPPKDQLFMKFDTDGRLLRLWTVPKGRDGREKPGELNWVHAMALDSSGNIYTGDIVGERAQKFVRKGGAPAEPASR